MSGCLVIDSSAIVAILGDEPERAEFTRLVAAATRRLISAATLLEARIVIVNRYGEPGLLALGSLIARAGVEIVAVTPELGERAFRAYRRFGKGFGTPGVLNFGDCFSFALAEAEGAPLLFKGDDFSRTDISRAE